jgi:Asp/Glu/Hydantoin racemase
MTPPKMTPINNTLALAVLHTSPVLAPLFTSLCGKWIPEARIFHLVDESLIKNTIAAGHLQKTTIRRLVALIGSGFEAGADAVLVTCSSIGPGVEIAQTLFDRPVIRVDEAMAQAAVEKGKRIGVIATLRTTLEPTAALVRRKAREAGKNVEIVECLCEGAFEAVMAGDAATHDRIVGEGLTNEMRGVEAIVLAQASMARVLDSLPPGSVPAPAFASPELGVKYTREILLGR